MRRSVIGTLALLGIAASPALAEVPVSLQGSPASMVRQNGVARELDLPFVRVPAELEALEERGELVRLEGNDDYELADFVRYSLARPEMRLFVERLSAQYREATGEKLVVTSLVRPESRQPGNSHALSVHPTGIAVDLRVSQRAATRQWLESTLLSLEEQGLLDVTRERSPPHYHVALFPGPYAAHVVRLEARERDRVAAVRAAALAKAPAPVSAFLAAEEPPAGGSRPGGDGFLVLALLVTLPAAWAAAAYRRRRAAAPGEE